MERLHVLDLFQGIATLVAAEPSVLIMRLALIGLGVLLVVLSGLYFVISPIPLG